MSAPLLALEFLAPTAGIVAASIAVPLLALLYFLKLRRRPLRVSSTLLWERAIQDLQVNAPFRWIRPSWLLVLQALILACLCLAAARPAVDLPTGAGGRLILLIDRSGSMSARDAGEGREAGDAPTRLELAKARAIELIDRLGGSGAQAMVVSFAAQAQTVSNFTSDRGLLRNAIGAIAPTDQPGNVGAALKVVEAFASRGDETGAGAPPPRVVLFSDGSLRGGGGLSAAIGHATFEFVRVGPEPEAPRDNIGIVALSARRDYEEPSVVRVFARLVSARSEETQATVRLELDGQSVEIRPVTVPAIHDDGRLGEAPVSFTLSNTTGGVLVLSLTRPDALPSDNAAALTLAPPSGARILLVQPGPARGVDLLLIDALRTLPPRELRRMAGEEYERRVSERGFFESFDLIVFDRVRPSELPPLPTISFGATVPIPGLVLEPTGADVAEFAYWLRTHPVMRYVSLNDVAVASPARVVTPDLEEGDGAGDVGVQTLASGPDGPLIVLLRRGAVRRLVVGFSLDATYWWRDLSFPIFIANGVDYLTLAGERGSGRQFTTTQPITIIAPSGAASLRVTGPGGSVRRISVDDEGSASIGVLPLAGVYEIAEIPAPEGVIPVNMFVESESAIATESQIEVAGREAVARPVAGMVPREIWSWFVGAALVLLALEWMIFAWRMRIR